MRPLTTLAVGSILCLSVSVAPALAAPSPSAEPAPPTENATPVAASPTPLPAQLDPSAPAHAAPDVSAPISSFWVAPTGSDAATGGKFDPFHTLERARDAIRDLDPRPNRDFTVYVGGGTYRRTQPFVLSPKDSGRRGFDIVYRNVPGEHPVLSGAVPVTGWTHSYTTLNGWIWTANVGQGMHSRQLWVNGHLATRARTEAYPAGFRPHWTQNGQDSGFQYVPTLLNPLNYWDPTTWTDVDDIEAVIRTQWKMMRVPLDEVAQPYQFPGPPGLITVQQPAWDNSNVFFDPTNTGPGIWAFWQVTYFENALQFLDMPGEWYLDESSGTIYYMTPILQDPNLMDVELPVLQTLVRGSGREASPVEHIRFEGLTFTGATWLQPSSNQGYIDDQNGYHLTGQGHATNIFGHDPNTEATPGNLRFKYAHNITFTGNVFEDLGATGLVMGTGSQHNLIEQNLFEDISSSGLAIGAVGPIDAHPARPTQVTLDNRVIGNVVSHIGLDYTDTAGITLGFTQKSLVENNTIHDTPWAAMSVGWGWGLLDPGSFPGVGGAVSGEWGEFPDPTPNADNVIRNNRMDEFLQMMWDGGAIYTVGAQGTNKQDALLIEGNVATNKRPAAGGNTFYTDGGSRWVQIRNNVSIDNPVGAIDLGPPPNPLDPLPYQAGPSAGNGVPYGSDLGGCRPYGDIRYVGNYWLQDPFSANVAGYNFLYQTLGGFSAYSDEGFFDPCPYTDGQGVSYPTRLTFKDNHRLHSPQALSVLQHAGVQERPETISADRWALAVAP